MTVPKVAARTESSSQDISSRKLLSTKFERCLKDCCGFPYIEILWCSPLALNTVDSSPSETPRRLP